MSLSIITVCHMKPEIIYYSIGRALKTMGHTHVDRWILVDHHYPIQKEKTSELIHRLAPVISAEVIKPEKNLGGHGGSNFALQYLKPKPNDLVCFYGPDSNPLHYNWLSAMQDVLLVADHYDSVALMHEHIVDRDWKTDSILSKESLFGRQVFTLDRPEMVNVSMWKGSALQEGLKSHTKYYGFVEVGMWKPGKQCYLYDYREDLCPIPHDEEYNKWKGLHASGIFPGNFDEYLAKNNLHEYETPRSLS